MKRVAVVGCGLIGTKRARALSGARPTVFCDVNEQRADALARQYAGAEVSGDWQATVARTDVDIVVVATTHNMLAPVAAAAAGTGKHVLIEKPGACRAAELQPVWESSRKTGALVRVGFNLRHHRAFQKAREIVDAGTLGPLMFLRARYGHGGRPGYDKEWRAVPELSGGGELVDQGMHLIDLARWFMGDFQEVKGFMATCFWDMPVEDNAFLLLRTAGGQVASLHASWTEWKNLFSFELYGKSAKLEVTGLGGSYGTERLALYEMAPEMGPPETTIWEFPMADTSWESEFAAFLTDIELGRTPKPGLAEAAAALKIVESAYQENRG